MKKTISIVYIFSLLALCFNDSFGAGAEAGGQEGPKSEKRKSSDLEEDVSDFGYCLKRIDEDPGLLDLVVVPKELSVRKGDKKDNIVAKRVYESGYDEKMLQWASISKLNAALVNKELEKILSQHLGKYSALKTRLLQNLSEDERQKFWTSFVRQLLKNLCQRGYQSKHLRLNDCEEKGYRTETYKELNEFFLHLSDMGRYLISYISTVKQDERTDKTSVYKMFNPKYISIDKYSIPEDDLKPLKGFNFDRPGYLGIEVFFATYKNVFL